MPAWVQWILFAGVAGVAWLTATRACGGRWAVWAVTAALALGAGAAWGAFRATAARVSAATEAARTLPVEGRPGGYVSSDSCQSCHPSEYASWHRSYHRTMTQFAGPEAVRAEATRIDLAWDGQPYRIERRSDGLWADMPEPAWVQARRRQSASVDPRPPSRGNFRLGLVTGSHHLQIFWVAAGLGNLQIIFPFAWLIDDCRWVPVDATFLRDPRLPPVAQSWNNNCIRCHTTAPAPGVGPEPAAVDSHVGELGIACEACHGPGEEHIRRYHSPLARYAAHLGSAEPRAVVQPVKLAAPMSSQVCGQCHGIKWIPASEPVNQTGFSYRPGDDLERTTPIAQPTRAAEAPWMRQVFASEPGFLANHYWPDGEVRVSGRDYGGLVDSPCFKRGKLTCVSCHSMHQGDSVNQLARNRDGNEACLQCHTDMRARVAAHTHHAPESPGSLCYNCHMPYTTYGLLKGIRTHRISSPNVSTVLGTGRPGACNLCHLDRTLAWTSTALRSWYGLPIPELSQQDREVSAAVLWMAKGDAGQRALAAYAGGRPEAWEASGNRWLAPHLAGLLEDPYPAVRYIAGRSLRRLPGFGDFEADFVAPVPTLVANAARAFRTWHDLADHGAVAGREALLMDASGRIRADRLAALRRMRDDRPLDLQE